MASNNIIAQINSFVEQAKAIEVACNNLLKNPALKEVTEFASFLEAFANGQPKPVAVTTGVKRTRRTQAQIEAEKATAASKGAV